MDLILACIIIGVYNVMSFAFRNIKLFTAFTIIQILITAFILYKNG